MAAPLGTIELIAQSLGKMLLLATRELSLLQARDWLSRFGVALPQAFFDSPAFKTPQAAMVSAGNDLEGLLKDLVAAAEGGDALQIVAKGLALINQVTAVIQSFTALQSGITTASAGLGIPPDRIADIADDFPRKLLDTLITEQLDHQPAFGEFLT